MAISLRLGGLQHQSILVCLSTATDYDGSSRHVHGDRACYIEQNDDSRGKLTTR